MGQISATPSPPTSNSLVSRLASYIFDVRFLGVLGQIAFIIVLILGARTLFSNFAGNAAKLGEAQFICRDGSFSYRCAYDFMDNEAGFDISDAPLEYTNTDSYWWAFYNGVLNTFRVGLLAVVATTILGTLAGIARMSENWLVAKIALAYVEIIRNTPLLIQLLLIYFSIILALPDIKEAVQPFGLPIFLSNRGLNLPWPLLMSSASAWVAFLVLGAIQFQVLWILLGKREEVTGHKSNRLIWGVIGFIVIASIGWFVSSSVADNEGLLVARGSRIREIEDIEKIMLSRAGVNHVDDFKTLSDEKREEVALKICVLRDSASEPNFTNKLRAMSIPYDVDRAGSPDRATADFVEGNCEVFAAPKSVLAAEIATLENPGAHLIVPIKETPVVWHIPHFEGFNVVGGYSMTGEFFALFIGLTVFYAGGLAEEVRAGIMSVSKGQTEAARALGLSEAQRLQLIVLPQALRVVIPPLISTYLSLMKDTSLGLAVAFPEMYLISQTLLNQSGRALQIMIIIMLVYLSISLTFSVLLNWYNSRVVFVER
ncbi:MAG: ABC transporter permease subunit [Anaerolineales bacterium]|nr:ABC transporter permease subunit [Anaerolineales bacterium]